MRHSSFWLDDRIYRTLEPGTPEYAIQLAAIRRAIANFVVIATGRDIPVKFSTGEQSYAYGDDSEQAERDYVVISATTDPAKFDVQVGIALHEAAHILLSKKTGNKDSLPVFTTLKEFVRTPKVFYTDILRKEKTRLGLWDVEMGTLFKNILNVLEDRRIDKWMYMHNAGYRGYYEAMYRDIWQSEKITLMFQSPAVNDPTVEAYMFHLINMTNAAATPTALPDLAKIWDIVDLPTIERFASEFPEMSKAVIEIAEVILINSKTPDVKKTPKDEPETGEAEPDPDNLDIPDQTKDEQELKDILGEMERLLDGEVEFDDLLDAEEALMDTLENSGATLDEVGGAIGKAPAIVYHKFTEAMARGGFHFCSGNRGLDIVPMINEGERMGTVLSNQLQIMAEETPLTYTRLSHGRIDKRRLAGLGYEQEDVFAQTFIERHDPVLVHLTIDSSGSMAGLKWKQSIKLAAALAKAAEMIPTMDVVISFRASSNATDIVQVLIAYDSRVDTFSKIKQLFPYILPTGGTPEGLAFEAIKSVIIESHSTTRRFFVNISDGQPDYHPPDRSFLYEGAKAWDHTRQQVQAFREAGIHILSYFVEDKHKQVSRLKTLLDPKKYATRSNEGFTRMYGPDAAIIDVDNVTAIAQTLNRLFLA